MDLVMAPKPKHIKKSLQRLDWNSRWRPIHIKTSFWAKVSATFTLHVTRYSDQRRMPSMPLTLVVCVEAGSAKGPRPQTHNPKTLIPKPKT